jgi:hypothetical protein
MSETTALIDSSLTEMRRQRRELLDAGADESEMIAIVVAAAASKDGWKQTFVAANEEAARARLASIAPVLPGLIFGSPPERQPLARAPFVVVIGLDVSGYLFAELAEFTGEAASADVS